MTPAARVLTEEHEAYNRQVLQLFEASKFDELEALADHARSHQTQMSNGAWKIHYFYQPFTPPRNSESEEDWLAHNKLHQEWQARFPKSVTARVTFAKHMVSHAWQARGGGYASTVTQGMWEKFHDRLSEALLILGNPDDFPPCPAWWEQRLMISMGLDEPGRKI